MWIFIAIVKINIKAIKFDEITVTFQFSKPNIPVIMVTEKKQLLIGTIIQINFLKTNHKVKTIKIKTPNPKKAEVDKIYEKMKSYNLLIFISLIMSISFIMLGLNITYLGLVFIFIIYSTAIASTLVGKT